MSELDKLLRVEMLEKEGRWDTELVEELLGDGTDFIEFNKLKKEYLKELITKKNICMESETPSEFFKKLIELYGEETLVEAAFYEDSEEPEWYYNDEADFRFAER